MLRVRTVMTGVAGTPWYTNLYFSGEASADADEALQKVGLFWAALDSNISTGVRIEVEGAVPAIDPATGDIQGFYSNSDQVFTSSGGTSPLPFATQGLISLNTAGIRNSRRVQGRIFVPGIDEAYQSGQAPSGNMLGFMQDAVDQLIGASGSGGDLVVWSRPKESPSPNPGPGAEFLVTSAIPRAFWAVLRSRRD